MRYSATIDYVFLINQMEQRPLSMDELPPLPSNARYIQHRNECYDWGSLDGCWSCRLSWKQLLIAQTRVPLRVSTQLLEKNPKGANIRIIR